MKHRTDIDGLRAVAVVPVVLYHVGLATFSGGFVGVDVFFVISGFLITSMITEDLRRDRFSLRTFYERRIRRIFPALFTVLLATTALSALILLPRDFASYGRSLMATALFGSNIFFWGGSDYFDAEAHTKPLLHTWSLAVEEQFYLFFPLLLLLIHRWMPGRWKGWILGLAVLSLATSLWGVSRYPEASFYLLPTRAWELFLGALLALGAFPALERQGLREAAAVLGVVLLGIAVCAFSESIPFPGAYALVPCVGAALVISAGMHGTNRVSRLLSLRPVVFIGLISYSLYLWHWPLLSLARHLTLDPLTGVQRSAIVALSVLLASLSWRFVEQPLRRPPGAAARGTPVFVWAGAVSAVAVVLGTFGYRSGGWPARVSPRVQALDAAQQDFNQTRSRCHASNRHPITYADACVYGTPGAPTRFAIWGDSHAAELSVAMGELAANVQSSVRLLSYSSCPPGLAFEHKKLAQCARHNAEVLRRMQGDTALDVVFLVARYAGGFGEPGNRFFEEYQKAAMALARSGKRVVLIYPWPEYPYSVPAHLARSALRGEDLARVGMTRAAFDSQSGRFVTMLDRIRDGDRIGRADPARLLCRTAFCTTYADGKALYFDDDHLSVSGARFLAPIFQPFIGPRATAAVTSTPAGHERGTAVPLPPAIPAKAVTAPPS